jgi:hypothetical protein
MQSDRPAEGEKPAGQGAQGRERRERGGLFDRKMPGIAPRRSQPRVPGVDQLGAPAVAHEAPCAGGSDETAADDECASAAHGPAGFQAAYHALKRFQLVSA